MKKILKIYWEVLKKRKWYGFGMFLAIIFINLLNVRMAVEMKNFANGLSLDVSAENIQFIKKTLQLIGFLFVGIWVGWRTLEVFTIPFNVAGMRDLEEKCFSTIKKQNIEFFQSNSTGSIIKKVAKFIGGFDHLLDWFFFEFINNILIISMSFYIFYKSQPEFALYFIIWIFIYITWSVYFSIYRMKFDEAESKLDSKIGAVYSDALSNISAIKTFAQEENEQMKVNEIAYELFKKRRVSWGTMFFGFAVAGILSAGIEYVLLVLMIPKWKVGLLGVGDFVLFQVLIAGVIRRLWVLGRNLKMLFKPLAYSREMTAIFERDDYEKDESYAKEIEIKNGNVKFKNISFEYDKTEGNVFENFSLTIKAGEKIALVGDSGSGKSTITKLLFRFFDIQKGEILFDGNDIRDFTYKSLRSQLSLVPQSPELFNRTIRENLIFAKPNATDKEINDALKKAQAYDFVMKLSKDLNTVVGERGVKLSGGEKQRIAIARAFLEDTKIVILDEATSALDSIIEAQIQKGIFELIKNKTSIVIAHRLSTILKMDRIIVLEGGKIVQDGTHNELINQKGKYAKMWKHQSGGFLLEK